MVEVRVSEVYASSQGEGPNVGKTTVFVRFGGCNLRCPGWPCDTQHAIDPLYRHEWEKHTVDELTERTLKVANMAGAHWITLTGGEPFLQPKPKLEEFVANMHQAGLEVEAFSNGTLLYPDWAIEAIHFIMDWKLPGSGETKFGPLNETRLVNLKNMQSYLAEQTANAYMIDQFGPSVHHAVKFVIKDAQDLAAAHGLWDAHLKHGAPDVEVFYGKVWQGQLGDADLVEYVMKNNLPWRLNVQVHQYVWAPDERGR